MRGDWSVVDDQSSRSIPLGYPAAARSCLAFATSCGYGFAVRIGPVQHWRYRLRSRLRRDRHHLAEHRVHIDRVIERLANPRIAERTPRRVDRDVPETQRRRRGEQLLLLGVCFPRFRRLIGNVEHVYVARLELGGRSAHLGDDARHQRIGFRRTIEVIRRSSRSACNRRGAIRRTSMVRSRPGSGRNPRADCPERWR